MHDHLKAVHLTRRDFVQKLAIVGASSGMVGILASCVEGDSNSETGPVGGNLPGLRVEALVAATGLKLALSAEFDATRQPLDFTGDLKLCGTVGGSSGDKEPICLTVPRHLVNSITIGEQSGDSYRILANGYAAPHKAPYELVIRSQPLRGSPRGTVNGYIYDPGSRTRLDFTISHETTALAAVWPAVLAAAILAAIAACLAAAIYQAVIDACAASARETCGSRGVESVDVKRNYGVSLTSDGFTLSCLEDCSFECKHDQGGG